MPGQVWRNSTVYSGEDLPAGNGVGRSTQLLHQPPHSNNSQRKVVNRNSVIQPATVAATQHAAGAGMNAVQVRRAIIQQL